MAPSLRRAAGRAPRRLLVALVGLTAFGGVAAGLALPGAGASPSEAAAPRPAGALEWFDAPAVSPVGLWTALLVLAACGAALFLFLRKARAPRGSHGRLEVLDTLPLAGKRFLHLVRCGELRLLVGSSEAGLFRVAALPQEGADLDEGGAFADLLEREAAR